ncbi:MAG: hypothetical protein JRH16_19225 [Deltaproteobacteria bacterium]|nr:hypothetical protein [Deltaproteobacteria bacterium]
MSPSPSPDTAMHAVQRGAALTERVFAACAERLFGDGCAFFFPYLALYVVGWAVDVDVGLLRRAFVGLHAANAALLVVFVWRRRAALRPGDALFWTALAALFLLPGAYLEYPSDPWEHFRRIYEWQNVDTVDEYRTTWKFAYFWGYSWLADLGPLDRRAGLDVYAAFWLLLTAVHLHVLAGRLGFDRVWSKIHVVAYFLFIGIGPLAFRHHALSSTPLAYIAFLRALVCCIDFVEHGERRALHALPLLGLLALANHRQEVLFIALSGAGVLLLAWFRGHPPAERARLLRISAWALLLAFAAGAFVRQLAPWVYGPGFDFQLTGFGGFRVWQRWYFMNVYGVHGALAVGFAVVLLRSRPQVGCLTLLPPAVLLTPPTALAISWLLTEHGGPPVTHRFLFAFPWSFALVEGLRRLVTGTLLAAEGPRAPTRGLVATAALLLALATPPFYPWQGRLFHLVHRPADDLALRFIDETADWFLRNREIPPDCRILTDPVTQFGLLSHLGAHSRAYVDSRRAPRSHTATMREPRELVELLREAPTCGVLVGIDAEMPDTPPSPISALSRHWDHRLAVPRNHTGDGFRHAAEALRAAGWTRTRVPPWYWFYEPPAG